MGTSGDTGGITAWGKGSAVGAWRYRAQGWPLHFISPSGRLVAGMRKQNAPAVTII